MRLFTERLLICDFTPDMARDVYLNSQDEENRRFVPDEVWESEEEARETLNFLISCYQGKEGPFVHPVFTREGNRNIGYVQLCPVEDGWEIGYHIAKDFRGQGYATEAARAFLNYEVRERKLSRVWGICVRENIASVHVMEKLGFEPVFEGNGEYQGEIRPIIQRLWHADPDAEPVKQ